MECVARALKSSFRPEVLVKVAASNPQPQGHLLDDFWGSNGQATVDGGSGDDFFVDYLLDFSKDDAFAEDVEIETTGENNRVLKVKEEEERSVIPVVTSVNNLDGSVSVPESELCVPSDDLDDLEWVSHFVDDSFPGYSLTYPPGKLPETLLDKKPAEQVVVIPVNNELSYVTPVQTKARSKRARTGDRVWSLGSLSLADSSTASSSSSSCTSIPWLIYGGDFSQTAESFLGKQPPVKKPKKNKRANETGGGGQQGRRCRHCWVQKTPQWRTGPMGAKTLCNACGVRFKSGRLLPEYRPACSPTFSSEVHSNNHRKVLEMRRKKDVENGSDLPVQRF